MSNLRLIAEGSFRHGLLMAAVICCAAAASDDAPAANVIAIEEHWEVLVGEPNGDASGPQITMVMSPTYNLGADFFLFTINHHTEPSFSAGGMQVQHWYNEDLQEAQLGPDEGLLSHNNETISWVQRMSIGGGNLTFEITDGASESWGSFGGNGHLRVSATTLQSNLNDYRPAISLTDSGVNYGGNRVESVTLKLLRWWDDEGNVYQYEAPIDVDTDLDP